MFRTIAVVFVLVVIPFLGGGDQTIALSQNGSSWCATGPEMEMLGRINALRQGNGLEPLSLSAPLGVAAEIKASDMATRNYFNHVSPDGVDPRDLLDSVGYTPYTSTAENIAAGHADAATTYNQWFNSPSHYHAMVSDKYVAIGIGRAYDADSKYEWYWVTEFGGVVQTPAAACDGTVPTPTATSVPPTATSVPPTATSVAPTATSVAPTATSVAPTATSVLPTATSIPPTATTVPPTATSVAPTATSVPPTDDLDATVAALVEVLIEILREILAG